jgi:hypothetical protein
MCLVLTAMYVPFRKGGARTRQPSSALCAKNTSNASRLEENSPAAAVAHTSSDISASAQVKQFLWIFTTAFDFSSRENGER